MMSMEEKKSKIIIVAISKSKLKFYFKSKAFAVWISSKDHVTCSTIILAITTIETRKHVSPLNMVDAGWSRILFQKHENLI